VVPEKNQFSTTTAGLAVLAGWLPGRQVELVAMEATGVYWKPVYYALEHRFSLWLCNARHVKKCPGSQDRPLEPVYKLLLPVPGLERLTIDVIVAETGADMTRFPSAGDLASWTDVRPGNLESAGKRRRVSTTRGNQWLRQAMIKARWGLIPEAHVKDGRTLARGSASVGDSGRCSWARSLRSSCRSR
jgi:transposase